MKNTKRNQKSLRVLYSGTRLFLRMLPLFLLALSMNIMAQKTTVTGRVVDSKNEAVIGATVMIKGTSTGTVSDFNGNFSLEAAGNDVLMISYVGMSPQQITVGTSKNLHIVMLDDTKALDEVVVIGYGTVKKRDLTTAVSTVSTKDIDERPIIAAADMIGRSSMSFVETIATEVVMSFFLTVPYPITTTSSNALVSSSMTI